MEDITIERLENFDSCPICDTTLSADCGGHPCTEIWSARLAVHSNNGIEYYVDYCWVDASRFGIQCANGHQLHQMRTHIQQNNPDGFHVADIPDVRRPVDATEEHTNDD